MLERLEIRKPMKTVGFHGWGYYGCVGEMIRFAFAVWSIDLETKSQTHSIATKKESGFSHDRGIKENLDGALPNYGVSPDSTDKITRISTDVKEGFGKDAGIASLII